MNHQERQYHPLPAKFAPSLLLIIEKAEEAYRDFAYTICHSITAVPVFALFLGILTVSMPRSRTGCANCRKRKRKCDETWPQCRACRDRKLSCGGPLTRLRWGCGIASRGRFAGAATPACPPASQTRRFSSSPVSTVSTEDASLHSPKYDEAASVSEYSDARGIGQAQHDLFRQCRFFSPAPS